MFGRGPISSAPICGTYTRRTRGGGVRLRVRDFSGSAIIDVDQSDSAILATDQSGLATIAVDQSEGEP